MGIHKYQSSINFMGLYFYTSRGRGRSLLRAGSREPGVMMLAPLSISRNGVGFAELARSCRIVEVSA